MSTALTAFMTRVAGHTQGKLALQLWTATGNRSSQRARQPPPAPASPRQPPPAPASPRQPSPAPPHDAPPPPPNQPPPPPHPPHPLPLPNPLPNNSVNPVLPPHNPHKRYPFLPHNNNLPRRLPPHHLLHPHNDIQIPRRRRHPPMPHLWHVHSTRGRYA